MPLHWTVTPEQAFVPGYDNWQNFVRFKIIAAIMRRIPQIESWMRANATWNDRTGEARRGLYAELFTYLEGLLIIMDHSAEHGRYLETSFGGRYQIIGPAIDHWGPIIMGDVIKALNSGWR